MDQYNRYSEIHEQLTIKDYDANREEIELIEILIDEYESREIDYKKDLNPVELFDYILTEDNISQAQIARELKVSRQLISDILLYRRNISKSMVMKLAKRFKMQPIAFSREYELKNQKNKAHLASS